MVGTRLWKAAAVLLMAALLCVGALTPSAAASKDDNEGKYVYLSDYLGKDATVTKTSTYKTVLADKTEANGQLTMMYDNQTLTFEKGIWAHATSTVVFDLSKIENYSKYKRLKTFIGLNTSAAGNGNGVKFTISVSDNNKDYENIWNEDTVFKGNINGAKLDLDLKGKKYLKLYADQLGDQSGDHAIYGDIMITTNEYDDHLDGPKLADLDRQIQEKMGGGASVDEDKDLRLLIMKRDFVSNFGEYTFSKYLYNHPESTDFLNNVFLENKHNLLEYYTFGDKPAGTYSKSMEVLKELYDKHGTDLDDQKNGPLYARMMVSLSMTHSKVVRLWLQDQDEFGKNRDKNDPESPNVSDPVTRYEVYKKMYQEGKLHDMFDDLPVAMLNLVFCSRIGDDEIEWLNDYTTNVKHSKFWYNPYWVKRTHSFNIYKDDYWNLSKLSKYKLEYQLPDGYTRDKKYPGLWMAYDSGGVCWIVANVGVNTYNAFGMPSIDTGQPGHSALVFPNFDGDTKKITGWTLQNSGWPWIESNFEGCNGTDGVFQARPVFGWGKDYYSKISRNAMYTWLASRCLNDYQGFVGAEYYVKLAAMKPGDENRETRINYYNKALEKQPYNFDAMLKLTEEYMAQDDTEKLVDHGKYIIDQYGDKGQRDLLPMYDLLQLILTDLNGDPAKLIELSNAQAEAFNRARESGDNDLYMTAKILMGDTSEDAVASFSFDGPNAGEIKLGSTFSASNLPQWGYYLQDAPEDQKLTWDQVKHVDGGKISQKLSQEELEYLYNKVANLPVEQATKGTDITIMIHGIVSDDITYQIHFNNDTLTLPQEVYSNDNEDKFFGYEDGTRWYWRDPSHIWKVCEGNMEEYQALVQARKEGKAKYDLRMIDPKGPMAASNMEFRETTTDRWKSFGEEIPVTEGNNSVSVRKSPHGTTVYTASRTYDFTQDVTPDTCKYVSVSGMEVADCSSQTQNNPAENAINGQQDFYQTRDNQNYIHDHETSWITEAGDNERYITLKLDTPAYLSQVEYVPSVQDNATDGDRPNNGNLKAGEVLASTDGMSFETIATFSDLKNDLTSKKIAIPEEGQAKKYSYVRLKATQTYSGYKDTEGTGTVFAARHINLYQNSEKNEVLTGVLTYSEENPTNKDVEVRLINLSTLGSKVVEGPESTKEADDTVVFDENGSHTFYLYDQTNGKRGEVEADVDWIDKQAPRAHVEYSTKEPTKEPVVATLEVDEKGTDRENVEMFVNEEWVPLSEIDKDLELDPDDPRKAFQANPYEATMMSNGEFDFKLRDKAGNETTCDADVTWVYSEAPNVDVTYSTMSPTSEDVTATLTCSDRAIHPVNGGSLTYTFEDNEEKVIEYQDEAGNIGEALVAVDWIDKEAPVLSVNYSSRTKSSEPVTATLVCDDDNATILGDGKNEVVFDKNGSHTFRVSDKAGNISEVKAQVTWITQESKAAKPSATKPSKPAKPGKP